MGALHYLQCETGSALKFKQFVRSVMPKICLERALLVTESFRQTENMPQILRRAYALEHVLSNMTIYISESELIVGNLASEVFAAPLFPEYAIDWFEKEMKDIPFRKMDRFQISRGCYGTNGSSIRLLERGKRCEINAWEPFQNT